MSETGRGEPWTKVNGVWQGDADSKIIITELPLPSDGILRETTPRFQLTQPNGKNEYYSPIGQILYEEDSKRKANHLQLFTQP